MAIKIDYNRLFYEPEALDMKNYPKVDDNWSIDFYDILADQEKKRYQELANNKLEEDEVERQALKEEFALLPQDAEVGDIIGAIEKAGQRSAALGGGIDLTWKAIQRRDDQEYRDAMSRYRSGELGKTTRLKTKEGYYEVGPDRSVTKIMDFPKETKEGKASKEYEFIMPDGSVGIFPSKALGYAQGGVPLNSPLGETRLNEIDLKAKEKEKASKPSLWNRLFGGGRGRRLEKIPEN